MLASKMNNSLPLKGVTVVSIEHAIAAPFCSRQLAELGARVIKVERPDGGDFARKYDERVKGMASHFVWANRSKESITLNLKSEQGKDVLFKLLAEADVLLQNLGPGAADRLGLSFKDLHSQFPKLIVCGISGYGKGGSYTNKKAYDLLIQSESGFLSVTGDSSDVGMAKAGCSIADIAAGMYAYTNILAALLERSHSGLGRDIDISMLEAMVEWMSFPLYYSFDGAPPPSRNGASHAAIAPYGPFSTADNEVIILGVQNDREWLRFCEYVMHDKSLSSDERFSSGSLRSANKVELNQLINEKFKTLNVEDVIARLEQADIANAKVNHMKDVWEHPQLKDRNRWVEIDSPVGKLPALIPPGVESSQLCAMRKIPELGENTSAILSELGLLSSEIEQLKSNKII